MNINIKNDIIINVDPVYLEDESEPEEDYFLWAYTINILNEGKEPIQLRSRCCGRTANIEPRRVI
jgi:uncharacterized protein affecting Mg2+/Co2+ transport